MENRPRVILCSERLIFRQHIIDDLEPYCAMEMDVEVRKYVGGQPRSYEDAKSRFMNRPLKPAGGDLAMWATVYKPDYKYIGRCGLYPHILPDDTLVSNEGTLAFYIAHAYWGRGLATEAGKAFIDFGFKEIGLSRIVTMVDILNNASLHVLDKLGFTLVREENNVHRSLRHLELLSHSFTGF